LGRNFTFGDSLLIGGRLEPTRERPGKAKRDFGSGHFYWAHLGKGKIFIGWKGRQLKKELEK